MSPYISSLYVYPVKSCRGIELTEAQITDCGIKHDRSWVIVNGEGTAVTQRDYPILCRVVPEIVDDDTIKLSAPNMEDLIVRKSPDGAERKAIIWGDECKAVDQGDEAANWFHQLLGAECRLLIMSQNFIRDVDPDYATGKQQVGFADGFPFLLISEASLADLNDKLEDPLPMNRFRPNIVAGECEAFSEDGWKRIRVGQIEFDIVKPCARCVVTTIDQDLAVTGKEPLRALALYRNVDNNAMFGQNLVHHSNGIIRVGDKIEVLALK